ncbi:hypothetical protein [Rhizobium lentis]|uniref:Uncharacterized protein n=1 Tax=Rhizobium lentis TaxID=1138194 RepID=A0ABS7IDS3_9HYPH|nr:hypothetical protein [Rhizobium lentis]MBX5041164.1 hypothetical protein [Rhizobium lentis]MBX5088471.1 hypothetical protein [Rhizobium lentis]
MLVTVPTSLDELAKYIQPFMALAGEKRWIKRLDQLAIDKDASYFRWKIVSDYHWLEMAIGFQAEVLAKEGRLRPDLVDELIMASLNFAAVTVEIHSQLSPKGRQVLEGRLRDALKAENGFAPVYLEFDLAQRLMDHGYDVEFADLEGRAQFDLLFRRGSFAGEVECKSLSADAGRSIHRKDFYRFMESIGPALTQHAELKQQEVLIVTLDSRLSSNTAEQRDLRRACETALLPEAPTTISGPGFQLLRTPFRIPLSGAMDQKTLYQYFKMEFGQNIHISGAMGEDFGCFLVMRSNREDDPSKPLLEAMRKAASQFTATRPGFIAIQEHGIEAADLMLPHVRRRMGILSYALFGHYGASHINATYVSGFGAVVLRNGLVGTPAFSIPNPQPKFSVQAADAEPFLGSDLTDQEYAEFIGAPLPTPNISFLPVEQASSAEQTD